MALRMDESAKDTLLHPHPSDMGCLRICGHYRPNHTPGTKSGVVLALASALTGAERIVPLYSQAHRVKAERHVQK